MPTESQNARYRSGYAAGQRDAVDQGARMPPTPQRPTRADPWSDLGYREGFADQRASQRHWLAQVLWLPEIASKVRRLARKEEHPS